MNCFQFIYSLASHKKILRLAALVLIICVLPLSPRTLAAGLVPAEIEAEYSNLQQCEARRSPCCPLLTDWSDPWGYLTGGVAEPETACLNSCTQPSNLHSAPVAHCIPASGNRQVPFPIVSWCRRTGGRPPTANSLSLARPAARVAATVFAHATRVYSRRTVSASPAAVAIK